MTRLSYALIPFALLAAVGCSSKSSGTAPDAPVITTTDAPPPIDAMPDALVCTAPEKQCVTGTCTNTDTDEKNCGDCNVVCKGGQACTTGACACPASFLPDTRTADPASDRVLAISQIKSEIGFAPINNGPRVDALLVSIGTDASNMTLLNHAYDMTNNANGASVLSPPVIAAFYNVDASSQMPSADAYYIPTAGTLKFTKICATEIAGTLTNPTFSGASFDQQTFSFSVDPAGCTFKITGTMNFDIQQGATGCP